MVHSEQKFNIPFRKIDPYRISVVFTWDDNSTQHSEVIAPLFDKYGFKCTFYVITKDLNTLDSYYSLSDLGFEIGSHTHSHKHMTAISVDEVEFEFRKAISIIFNKFNNYPSTFAFPHHDSNPDLICQAKLYHLETRNTLSNAHRFSLKTKTSLDEVVDAVNYSLMHNCNLVFSGHSTLTKIASMNGYEPISPELLEGVLKYLSSISDKLDVITFCQAALKEFIKEHLIYDAHSCLVTKENLGRLNKYGLSNEKLLDIL